MSTQFCSLVRRDHDELDRVLVAMLVTATPVSELAPLLRHLQRELAIHASAEARVFDRLLTGQCPPVLQQLIAQAREEHRAQEEAALALAELRPGSEAWYDSVLDLRINILDHASRADLRRWSINDHVPVAQRQVLALALAFATERRRLRARAATVVGARMDARMRRRA